MRFILGRMMRITLVIQVLGVNLDDSAADVSGFRVPGSNVFNSGFCAFGMSVR
jgi:hypothetical protein